MAKKPKEMKTFLITYDDIELRIETNHTKFETLKAVLTGILKHYREKRPDDLPKLKEYYDFAFEKSLESLDRKAFKKYSS